MEKESSIRRNLEIRALKLCEHVERMLKERLSKNISHWSPRERVTIAKHEKHKNAMAEIKLRKRETGKIEGCGN